VPGLQAPAAGAAPPPRAGMSADKPLAWGRLENISIGKEAGQAPLIMAHHTQLRAYVFVMYGFHLP
jgi:hypothetical protein